MVDEMKIDCEKEGDDEGEMIDDVNEMDNGDITLTNKKRKYEIKYEMVDMIRNG